MTHQGRARDPSGSTKRHPRTPDASQGTPKGPQRMPKDPQPLPRGLQMTPTATPTAPNDAQGILKDLPRDTQGTPRGSKDPKGSPRTSKEPPKDLGGLPNTTKTYPQHVSHPKICPKHPKPCPSTSLTPQISYKTPCASKSVTI